MVISSEKEAFLSGKRSNRDLLTVNIDRIIKGNVEQSVEFGTLSLGRGCLIRDTFAAR